MNYQFFVRTQRFFLLNIQKRASITPLLSLKVYKLPPVQPHYLTFRCVLPFGIFTGMVTLGMAI